MADLTLGSLLDEAKRTITGERQDQYGAPEDSFGLIASYWEVYLARPVSPLDVAHLMALMKLARAQGRGFKRDTYVDLAGYAAIAADRLAPEVPEPKRSCSTCQWSPEWPVQVGGPRPCDSCQEHSEWAEVDLPVFEPAPKPEPEMP